MMIEVEVHSSLRAFLREQGNVAIWPHHLTMARLVARALRLRRSALIQTGVPFGDVSSRYRLSYLMPALMWNEAIVLVASKAVQQHLLVEIPQLQQWIQKFKDIQIGDAFPDSNFQGILLTEPSSWLATRFKSLDRIPTGIPTIIDGVDDLEEWARNQLTVCIQPEDWDKLMLGLPDARDAIREARVQMTKAVFQHPANPYECYLIEAPEQDILRRLYERLGERERGRGGVGENPRFIMSRTEGEEENLFQTRFIASGTEGEGEILSLQTPIPIAWRDFWHRWQMNGQMMWASIQRGNGLFSLHCGPVEVTQLGEIWQQQPVVLIGGTLDLDARASVYRQQMGLGDMTCLQFSLDRQSELIQLYLPDGLPMPNTPEFQDALIQELQHLLRLWLGDSPPFKKRSVVILIGDTPLKAQVGAVLAAEFGSRVQVEKIDIDNASILVTGWEFWRRHQSVLPSPSLLTIATLPIPSLENPLVAGRVAHYKEQRQDWFRLYLLPVALRELQRAIAPMRESQGIVALFDSRVNHRSYGQQVLAALSPMARLNYLDPSWFAEHYY